VVRVVQRQAHAYFAQIPILNENLKKKKKKKPFQITPKKLKSCLQLHIVRRTSWGIRVSSSINLVIAYQGQENIRCLSRSAASLTQRCVLIPPLTGRRGEFAFENFEKPVIENRRLQIRISALPLKLHRRVPNTSIGLPTPLAVHARAKPRPWNPELSSLAPRGSRSLAGARRAPLVRPTPSAAIVWPHALRSPLAW